MSTVNPKLLTREDIDQRFDLGLYYSNYLSLYYMYYPIGYPQINRIIFLDGDSTIKGNLDAPQVIIPAAFNDEGNVDVEKFIDILKSGQSPFIEGAKRIIYYPQ